MTIELNEKEATLLQELLQDWEELNDDSFNPHESEAEFIELGLYIVNQIQAQREQIG